MQSARAQKQLTWAYFDSNTTVLLDKLYKFEDSRVELGGSIAEDILSYRGAVAVHTTCYEQKTKMMGLKAANAFWNPLYYNPQKRTLTKRLLYLSETQLRNEIRALLYLALVTNRSLIIPNLQGHEDMDTVQHVNDKFAFWPGFRLLHLNKNNDLAFDALEPAFYWRVSRDYVTDKSRIPRPKIVTIPPSQSISDVEKLLAEYDNYPRVVLDSSSSLLESSQQADRIKMLEDWAEDSASVANSFSEEQHVYEPLSALPSRTSFYRVRNPKLSRGILDSTRTCQKIFHRIYGNRSCFDKCD